MAKPRSTAFRAARIALSLLPAPATTPMIVHLDADAFFASVEQAADPKLRGKPIAVGGERRGIIASASYEARKLGIYTPMPTARARKLCPRLIVLPGDFELVVNLQFDRADADDAAVSFGCGTFVKLRRTDGWILEAGDELIALPADYEPQIFHQFRSVNIGGGLEIYLEGVVLGSFESNTKPAGCIKLTVQNAAASFDMVRYTIL